MSEAMRLHRTGRLAEAELLYRRILAARPDYAPALSYLGLLEHKAGRAGGLKRLALAVKLAPDVASFWLNYGLSLDEAGDAEAGERALRRAVALQPGLFEARMALAACLQRRGRLDDALPHYRKALAAGPRRIEVYINLGGALNDAKRFDEAREVLEAGRRIESDNAALNFNLGLLRANENRTEEAIACFRAAATQRAGYTNAIWHAALALPAIYRQEEDIAAWRQRWSDGLARLEAELDLSTTERVAAAIRAVLSTTNFHLHYQGEDDRALQARYGRLVQRIAAARYPAFTEPLRPRMHDRLRVGFMSHFFRHHSIAKTHAAWATGLDRRRFEVFVIHTGGERDSATDSIAAAVEHFHHRPRIDEALFGFVRGLELDVLVYPDLGMEPVYQLLAALRLAPVQCNGLGHPVTAGFDTIDVALSSARMEPPDGEEHYGERLVRLANLGFCYRRPSIETAAHFDRPGAGITYVCAQNLTKLLPAQDALFARIAADVPGSVFWFVAQHSDEANRQFAARLTQAFAAAGVDAGDRIRVLPRMDQQSFYAMYRAADVYLDGHAWSGCNTTFEALACGLPVVAWPGRMMRGRHSAAILDQAGLAESVADSADGYVELAARLGRDAAFRRELADLTQARAARVFDDRSPIDILATFLQSAAGSA